MELRLFTSSSILDNLVHFSLLQMNLRANWQQMPEIPPRPPLTKGGWGDFREIHQYVNIAFLVPVWPG
jgi:hypothetical protein